jgi:YihY family inner membrane protein
MAETTVKLQRRLRIGRIWATIWRALVKYDETDGEQRAASFAYYALFALLPLIVLLIALGSRLLGSQEEATREVFRLMGEYSTVDVSSAEQIRPIVEGFMNTRLGSGSSILSGAVVLWCALRFFQSLVHGVNKAWGTKEYTWWRLPLKNLLMIVILTSALLIGVVAPAIVNSTERFYADHTAGMDMGLGWWVFRIARMLIPSLLLFYALLLFYKFAPRRKTTFREVWLEALWVTAALAGLQKLFVFFAMKAAVTWNFNAVYGTFGSVMALLMWVYLTGAVIILGGCFCAARAEIRQGLADQAEKEHARWQGHEEPL